MIFIRRPWSARWPRPLFYWGEGLISPTSETITPLTGAVVTPKNCSLVFGPSTSKQGKRPRPGPEAICPVARSRGKSPHQVFLLQVSNKGDSPENDNDIVVTARIPLGSVVVEPDTSGPAADIKIKKEPGLVRFSAVTKLPPKATIDYRVVVTTSKSGAISLHAEATSRRQTQAATGERTVDVLPDEGQ